MTAAAIFDSVRQEVPADSLISLKAHVSAVEDRLQRETRSAVALVDSASKLTLDGGGKRLRPILAALAAYSVSDDPSADRLVSVGACLEMIHMATLIHDDVIDEAPTRRGSPTASAVYGSTGSILSGDVLLAKSMRILAVDGDLPLIHMVSEAMVEMAEGEVREVEVRGDFDLDEEAHRQILRMKTAAFIECCCRAGGQIGGATEEQQEALSRYGHHLGMAFQVADDILDYRGRKEKTGKGHATDFREGCATLPLILLKADLSSEEIGFVRGKFGNGVTDQDLAMIGDWMEQRGAFRRSEEAAQRHASEAEEALNVLPESAARTLLQAIARFTVQRDQ